MKIGKRKRQSVLILDLEGNIDINASDLIETIGKALNEKIQHILCNFSGINLVDYIGVSVLAIVYKNVLNHEAIIKLYNVPGHIQKLFTIVGLDKVFEFYKTEEGALRSFVEDTAVAEIVRKKLRRRFKRIPFNCPIEYGKEHTLGATFYRGKILNLSGVGAFVIGENVFDKEEILLAKLHLLPKPGIITVKAKVIWASHENIHPLEYPAMGIEFYNLGTEEQKIILEFVEKHLTTNEL